MPVKIVGLHRHVAPLPAVASAAPALRHFYAQVLGLVEAPADDGTLLFQAGPHSQLRFAPAASGNGAPDPPHLSLAVGSIAAARRELDRMGVACEARAPEGEEPERIFLQDPAGNLVELHEISACSCTAHAQDLEAGYAKIEGTVLFADMRGFTAVAERLNPAQVVPLLNEYFAMLGAVVSAHGGTVFHIAGDGLMAGFGVPEPQQDASERAVDAACEMIARFQLLAADWKRRLGVEAGLGIGINAGEFIAGDVGAPERPSYTLIGDTVNVAARLVQRARAGEALFSRSVRQSLKGAHVEIVELPPLMLRGRSNPVDIFCIPAAERLDTRPQAVAG